MVPNAQQEKKERGSTNLVRDKLHHQAEYLHTPGVNERQAECRSGGLEGTAD
jgi:hypothetical protein